MQTKSYVVGSTNSLLLQQKERYCDLLVNLDDDVVQILNPSLKTPLALSTADRRWIDFLTQSVNDTWDDNDRARPNTYGYAGSEEFLRLQFEEYLIALLSATKYHQYMAAHKDGDPKRLLADVEGDPSAEFAHAFVESWQQTENYSLWNRTTDSQLFDIVEPRHPMAGGLTIEDVQRRLASQISELHLDERFNQTREVVGKRLADGRTQVSSAFNKVWADIEVMREAQRKRAEDARANAAASPQSEEASRFAKPDLTKAQASVSAASQRAGAYLSSWGSWAAEKRKTGWYGKTQQPETDENGTGKDSTSTSPGPVAAAAKAMSTSADRPHVTTVSEWAGTNANTSTVTKSEKTGGLREFKLNTGR